jgi:hypothetical protein
LAEPIRVEFDCFKTDYGDADVTEFNDFGQLQLVKVCRRPFCNDFQGVLASSTDLSSIFANSVDGPLSKEDDAERGGLLGMVLKPRLRPDTYEPPVNRTKHLERQLDELKKKIGSKVAGDDDETASDGDTRGMSGRVIP